MWARLILLCLYKKYELILVLFSLGEGDQMGVIWFRFAASVEPHNFSVWIGVLHLFNLQIIIAFLLRSYW